jgi:hypothetical protein
MKKLIITCLAVVACSNVAFADAPTVYGDIWANSDQNNMHFQEAVLGIQAGLGGPAAADLSYDAANHSLYTAKLNYSGIAFSSDVLSAGLQAQAYDALLDTQLGSSALNCFSCNHVKSAIYSAYGFSLEGNENNNYSGTYSYAVLPNLKAAASVDYDHPSDTWAGKGALLGSYSIVSGVVYGSDNNGVWDYGAVAQVTLAQFVPNLGVFGKYAKYGALAAGPTYQATKGLLVAALVTQDQAGDTVHGQVRLSANF